MHTTDAADDRNRAASVDAAFAAVVALKAGESAKSRLDALPASLRRELARAMAFDTLAALAAASSALVVVSDQPELEGELARAGITARVVSEPPPGPAPSWSAPHSAAHAGMNAALRAGAELLRRDGHGTVLASVGDLPALRPASLTAVITALAADRGFVADRSGIGTTMLLARDTALLPRFGGASALAHRESGAVPLPAPDDARSDVDTISDLRLTAPLGLGPRTAALVAASAELAAALAG